MSASPGDGANLGPEGLRPENLGPEYERAKQRAEVLLTTWGTRLGIFAATVGSELQKAAARAREEAEDIWAEAQAQAQAQTTREENGAPPS